MTTHKVDPKDHAACVCGAEWVDDEYGDGCVYALALALRQPTSPRPSHSHPGGDVSECPTPEYHETHRYCPSCPWREEVAVVEHPPVQPPYYEVTVRLPLDLYNERWFDRVAVAAGDRAAVSGSIVPEPLTP